MTSARSITATFAKAAAHETPGSYTVVANNSDIGYFYVSTAGTQVQDVRLSTTLSCTPSSNLGSDHIQFASITINSGGSFSGSATQHGVVDNEPATFTYKLSGQFSGTTARGSLRENVTFNNGNQISCTTGPVSWTASRDSQGSQTTSPSPGSYTVVSNNSDIGYFYVSTNRTQLQDVRLSTGLSCTPSSDLGSDHIQFASIAIKSGGSFTGSATQQGVVDNEPATFTYTFTGHFHGTTTGGIERVAGQLRENVTFNNGNQISCTTGPESWTASRDSQGTQTTSPSPGSYTVVSNNSDIGSFSVSSDGTELQNVSVSTSLACTPSYNAGSDHVQFASIAISHQTFTGMSTQSGTFGGYPATFTYTFNGHFHGKTSGGSDRFAGQLREDITFNNGNQISCTTGPQSWTASGP